MNQHISVIIPPPPTRFRGTTASARVTARPAMPASMHLLMSLPFGALAEAGLQPTKRCSPFVILRSSRDSIAKIVTVSLRGPRQYVPEAAHYRWALFWKEPPGFIPCVPIMA
jgi:hypothetical protein